VRKKEHNDPQVILLAGRFQKGDSRGAGGQTAVLSFFVNETASGKITLGNFRFPQGRIKKEKKNSKCRNFLTITLAAL